MTNIEEIVAAHADAVWRTAYRLLNNREDALDCYQQTFLDALLVDVDSVRIDYLCMKLDQWESIISRDGGWVGEGVRPGEHQPLCWWRESGSNEVRVLYADLTIRSADEPPVAR